MIRDYKRRTKGIYTINALCVKFGHEKYVHMQRYSGFPTFNIQFLTFRFRILRFQILFGIPSELYRIPVGVGLLGLMLDCNHTRLALEVMYGFIAEQSCYLELNISGML